MNNIRVGNSTEKKVSGMLRKAGFWSYNCPRSSSGAQPVDIIAVRGGDVVRVLLIDAKHVRDNEISFTFDRIEPNQIASLRYCNEFAHIDINGLGFCIDFDRKEDIFWLPFGKYLEMTKQGLKSVNMNELKLFSEMLGELQ